MLIIQWLGRIENRAEASASQGEERGIGGSEFQIHYEDEEMSHEEGKVQEETTRKKHLRSRARSRITCEYHGMWLGEPD